MKYLPAISLSLMVLVAFGQDENELDKRNGFKDIKMATPIDSVKGAEFKKDISEKGAPLLKLYQVDGPDYESIGGIPVDKIEIQTYKGLVYTISVITDKDPALMKGLKTALGPPEFNVRDNNYIWSGKKLSLTFSAYSRNKLGLLYRSNKVVDMMKADQEKRIEKIADDF